MSATNIYVLVSCALTIGIFVRGRLWHREALALRRERVAMTDRWDAFTLDELEVLARIQTTSDADELLNEAAAALLGRCPHRGHRYSPSGTVMWICGVCGAEVLREDGER